jgi:TonB family protein
MAQAWKKWEGQVVNGEFQLRQYLGGSDHSAVFLSQRGEREPQQVAIKLILANAENPELQLSWWELAAKLSHPHLLRLFQRGRCQLEDTELFYAVMEYAEESLAQIIPYRPLTPAEAHDTFQPVLDALAYIHARGFVHGHINPSNIMAVGDQIKLSSDELCGAGESGRVLGTPDIYAAPEIVDGGGMSPASDIWSLGLTLVEALTQRLPFSEETRQTELILPDTMPEPFFDVASHCLRRDPQRRWTVADIAARLRRPTAPAPLRKETVRPRKASAKWGYIAAMVAAGFVLWAILNPHVFNRHPNAEPEPFPATESSQAPPETKQGPGPGSPAQITADKKQEQGSDAPAQSNVPPVAAKTRVAENVAAENPTTPRAQGVVVQQVPPDVSRSALRTIHGKLKVRVKVTVDSSGNVTVAKFDSRGPSRYFAERALRAAQRWTFAPPQIDGKSVPSEWMLKFEFERSGTNVHPAQTFP